MTSPDGQHAGVDKSNAEHVREHTITVRITPDCLRLEISKPYHEQNAWLVILDAVAHRWGHCGTAGGQQTLWAELTLPHRTQ